VTIKERLFLLLVLYRANRGGHLRTMLLEEYLWQQLASDAYVAERRDLVLGYLLNLCCRYINAPGARGKRVRGVLGNLATNFGSELPLDKLGSAGSIKLCQWSGLVNYPALYERLRIPSDVDQRSR
jgi:hypothetical protein